MTDIVPRAVLRVYDDDREAFGHVYYVGDSLSYDLPGLMGTPGATYSGFDRDPTGTYLMQQMVPIFYDADPSAWTTAAGGALPASYSFATDPTYGVKFLRHLTNTDAFDVRLAAARVLDEGFYANFYIAAGTATGKVPAAVNFYVEFSRGRAAREPGLRLALEPGKVIRLQVSLDDDKTWTDVASADALGDCEAYLTQAGRYFNISVLPMTDAAWYAGLPATLDGSGAPPNQIVVSINGGDAVLSYTDEGLAEGAMAVTGQFRQWSVRPCLLRFSTAGNIVLPPQFRPAKLLSDPVVFLNGYAPDAGAALSSLVVPGQVLLDASNSAHVEMTLAAAPDATGYALHSCFLASVDAEFPPLQIPPMVGASYIDYELVYSSVEHRWDQTTGTVRHRAEVWLTNQNNEFAPGLGAALGVRAATVFHSADGVNFVPEITGYTAMEENGQEWIEDGFLRYFKLSVSDKLVHTEPDTAICCGFQLPYDFQCQYYAFGQQAYRLGIPDFLWQFPLVRRNDAAPYYYLDGGTTKNPVHRFPPDMTLGESMEHVRAAGAEIDPATNSPVPMVMGTDAVGRLLFFGMPTGVATLLANPDTPLYEVPDVQPAYTFSAVPAFNDDGSAQLNEFVQTWGSKSSLRRVRNPVVMVGADPQTGSMVFGVAYNEKLGSSWYAQSAVPGYIGVDKPLYIVSRLYSSQAVAALGVQNAAVQLGSPAIDTGGTLHLQPGLMPLTVVAINDFASQGTTQDVLYYTTYVKALVDLRNPKDVRESTQVSGRVLGLSS